MIPALSLENGANRVALSLYNRTIADLSAVSASVEQTGLPSWLSIQCGSDAVYIPGGSSARGKLLLVFTVKDAPSGAEASVPLAIRDADGTSWTYTIPVKIGGAAPLETALIGNYPNPFNPSTAISYSLKESGRATLFIYNALGQKVRTLVDGPRAAGKYTARWDGKDETGKKVSSGVYYYRLIIGKFIQTKKMVMVE